MQFMVAVTLGAGISVVLHALWLAWKRSRGEGIRRIEPKAIRRSMLIYVAIGAPAWCLGLFGWAVELRPEFVWMFGFAFGSTMLAAAAAAIQRGLSAHCSS